MKKWLKRKSIITIASVAIAAVALFHGKMSDSVWVYAMAVFIAGHHAEDLIRAWRSQPTDAADRMVLADPSAGVERDWRGDAGASQPDHG